MGESERGQGEGGGGERYVLPHTLPPQGRSSRSYGNGYLVMENVSLRIDVDEDDTLTLLEPADEEDGEAGTHMPQINEDEEEDKGSLAAPPTTAGSSRWLVFDYHIVYNPSYNVPVLFFNVKAVGMGEECMCA